MQNLTALAGVVLGALLVTGCAAQDPTDRPTPRPTSTPVFASDDEALAAAESAYAEYLQVSDAISADGGANPERMEPFVTPEQLEAFRESVQNFRETGAHTSGATTFDSLTLSQVMDNKDGTAAVVAYACVSVLDVRIFDASNSDVTPSNRDEVVPLEIEFEVVDEPREIVLARSEIWSGQDFCS